MLTLHIAEADDGPIDAVLVDGERVAALGPAGELEAAHPQARVRRWRGTLGPGRLHDGPLPDAPSARERVHAVLRLGATAVRPEQLTDPALRTAASRVGLAVGDREPALTVGGRADLAVFGADGECLATVLAGRLVHRRA
ncbi:hypothetical protein [Streptacidiphilus sp. EB129]|uniref:imidazolonepropionase-like domain-containing protein n=1 Tax=Streptacidiphilus sp. EB129 TaxID=3156262 RepID=UPI00351731A8